MILQCSIIFGFLAIGELIVYLTGLPLPSGIIGMILLTCSLKAGIIKVEWVEGLADFLIRNLGFFFVPAGVGLMECAGIIKEQWMPIVVATIVSTAVIIAVTGQVHQFVRRSTRRLRHD
ncbi:MAG: CidA/LrgA family protein [Muribaculaceae bacterium]|nr:CidA/LrgA family protein [Muribaculaceae bacterium]